MKRKLRTMRHVLEDLSETLLGPLGVLPKMIPAVPPKLPPEVHTDTLSGCFLVAS